MASTNPFSISLSFGSKDMTVLTGSSTLEAIPPERKLRKSCRGVTWWRSAMKHTASSMHKSSNDPVSCFIIFLLII